jgi:hypothetical protein
MAQYRLYCLNDRGKFTKAQEINAADDADALNQAREMKLPVRCELWEHGRMIAELAPYSGR